MALLRGPAAIACTNNDAPAGGAAGTIAAADRPIDTRACRKQLEVLLVPRHLEMGDFAANIIGFEPGWGNQSATLGLYLCRASSR